MLHAEFRWGNAVVALESFAESMLRKIPHLFGHPAQAHFGVFPQNLRSDLHSPVRHVR